MAPDLNITKAFLSLVDPDGIFTFQTFSDSNEKSSMLNCVRHGTLDEHHVELTRLQKLGAGVFFMVNRGDGVVHEGSKTCRTMKSVVAVRALFIDLDGAPIEPVLKAEMPPHIVVESSPGRWHGYWLTNDCPLNAFKPYQQQIAAKFGGDMSVNDLPRVMRLPGFLHQKAKPFMARVVYPEAT
jgi:hypothetical protein